MVHNGLYKIWNGKKVINIIKMNNQEIITLVKLSALIVGLIVALIVGVINMSNDIKEAQK